MTGRFGNLMTQFFEGVNPGTGGSIVTKTKLSDYFLTSEAAAYLGVSKNTVRTWAEEGKIPVARSPAGYRVFRQRDLDKVLQRIEQDLTRAAKRRPIKKAK